MDRLIASNTVDAAHADTAPASGTPGFATDGNPATGVPASLWPAYQYNAFQEELIAVIEAAGLAPDKTSTTQVLAAIRALFAKINGDATQTFAVAPATASDQAVQLGQLSSGADLTTPAKFDDSTAMATTQFVWQNRSGFNGVLGFSSSTTLTLAQLGSYIVLQNTGAAFTVTLPVTATSLASVSTRFVNLSSQAVTIQTQGGGTIQGPFNTVGASSFTIPTGNSVDIACNNSNNFVVSGDGQLASSSMFASAAGYQTLPTGKIIQFGAWTASATPGNPVAVSYPIPFPNSTDGIATTVSSATTSIVSAWYDTPTKNGFNGHGNLASLTCNFIAIGH